MKKPFSGPELRIWPVLCWLGIFSPLLGACLSSSDPTPTPVFFLPPTLAATPLPPQPATATSSPPSPTPSCEDNIVFLEDITIPDGTIVGPGAQMDKRWLVQNAGTCNWENNYRLNLVAGTEMGAPTEQALFPARSGTEVEIRIVFTAPEDTGSYRSAWQAFNPDGKAFGDPIFIEIIVEEDGPEAVP
jgi:hypothetical protein